MTVGLRSLMGCCAPTAIARISKASKRESFRARVMAVMATLCLWCNEVDKPLTVELAARIVSIVWQVHLLLDTCFMISGHRDLDDLAACFTFEDAMADLRRLDNPVARLKPKRLALV